MARRLYLLVKGPDGKWGFPQTEWKQGDKMRETATRALVEQCGTGDKSLDVEYSISEELLSMRLARPQEDIHGRFLIRDCVLFPGLHVMQVGNCPMAYYDSEFLQVKTCTHARLSGSTLDIRANQYLRPYAHSAIFRGHACVQIVKLSFCRHLLF